MTKRVSISLTVLLSCILLTLSGQKLSAETINKGAFRAAISKDVLADFHKFLAGRNPVDITEYGGEFSRRDVIEVVLIHQALARAGLREQIDFRPIETYSRQLAEVSSGRSALSLTSVWREDSQRLQATSYISKALIEADEFIAGFYVRPNNKRALSAKNFSEIKTLTAVCNPSWQRDWKLLHSFMPNDQIHSAVIWGNMVRMINLGRVDFVLAPFQQTPNLELIFEDIKLIPIPGVKVSLGESRHVLFSREHPKGAELFDKFNKGLDEMSRLGLIKKAYTQSGFFNLQVKDWTLIPH